MIRFILAAAGFILLVASPLTADERGLLPEPVKREAGEGFFVMGPETAIAAENPLGARFSSMLSPATGFPFPVIPFEKAGKNTLVLLLDPTLEALGEEGYQLEVAQEKVKISAHGEAGLFYGTQTLLQLMPSQIFEKETADSVKWEIPCVTIEDYPRFAWRGAMLDVCRHFMPMEFVLRFIDLLALHKMNRLHLHLTDDQGWRIEILKYPELTEVGAWREETLKDHYRDQPHQYDGELHGGYYTQDEIREMVAYAAERHITIVPEIEMPGHAQAAIAAYPELGCTGKELPVRTIWGVNRNIFNANEATILFLQDVLAEVLELFPGEFIHIGGDEAPKDQWKKSPEAQARIKELGLKDEHELQSYFIRRMDEFLTKRGRRLIGWDEILEGGLAPGATVMSWRGDAGGIEAARMGHDAVMAPTHSTYFDYYQSKADGEPLAIGGFLPLEKVYEYEPVPMDLSAEEARHIIGTQGQLWSEYIKTPEKMEYMGFPRLCALAEVAWSFKGERSFDAFLARLKIHFERLDALGVNYRPLEEKWTIGQWNAGDTAEVYRVMEWDLKEWIKKPGRLEITFQYTKGAHRLDIEWVEIVSHGRTVARDAHHGITGTGNTKNTYFLDVEAVEADAGYTLVASVRSDGGTDSSGEVHLERKAR